MSALADITLMDALGTPVAHVFKPINHNGKDFTWRDGTSGLTVLSAPFFVITILPSKDKTLERYRERIVLPAVETVTGQNAQGYTAAPKLAYSLTKVSDYIMPVRATEQQKKDLLKYGQNLSANAQVSDLLLYGISPY